MMKRLPNDVVNIISRCVYDYNFKKVVNEIHAITKDLLQRAPNDEIGGVCWCEVCMGVWVYYTFDKKGAMCSICTEELLESIEIDDIDNVNNN